MNDYTQHKFWYRVPAIVLGAAFGVWLSLLVHPAGGFFLLLGSAVVGIVVGLWIHNDVRGLLRATHAGAMRNIALWTVLGGMAGGMFGLLIRKYDCQAPVQFPWLFDATVWTTWLRCASIGGVLTLLQAGDHYNESVYAMPKSGQA